MTYIHMHVWGQYDINSFQKFAKNNQEFLANIYIVRHAYIIYRNIYKTLRLSNDDFAINAFSTIYSMLRNVV